MADLDPLWSFTREPRVAYCSMEIALESGIPTYSGGLGMLAGDTVRSAADLEIPLVAVTLASRAGYFRQSLSASGEQLEAPDLWDPAAHATPLGAHVGVQIESRTVWLTAWLYVQECPCPGYGRRLPKNSGGVTEFANGRQVQAGGASPWASGSGAATPQASHRPENWQTSRQKGAAFPQAIIWIVSLQDLKNRQSVRSAESLSL